jgi:hypothetical protein
MAIVEKAIELDVPVQAAYEQWSRFEQFPNFMEGVIQVRKLSDDRLRWTTELGGQRREWDARIDEQIPEKRIAWHSEEGSQNAGVVTFHRLSDDRSRIMLQLGYEPEGAIEVVGDSFGLVSRRVQGDLERFKDYVEGRHGNGRSPRIDRRRARRLGGVALLALIVGGGLVAAFVMRRRARRRRMMPAWAATRLAEARRRVPWRSIDLRQRMPVGG